MIRRSPSILALLLAACGPVSGGGSSPEAVGLVDEIFQAKLGSGFNGPVDAIALQSDGAIVLAGRFSSFNGQTTGPVVRLDGDGNLDTAFQALVGTSADNDVFALAVDSSDHIYLAGRFASVQGAAAARIARLEADGGRDASFNPTGTGFDGTASVLELSGDRLYVGGEFSTYKSQSAARLARLKTDGSLDTDFQIGTGFNLGVDAIRVQGDGRVLVGGSFTNFNGLTRNRLARLNSNGAIDADFQTAMGSAFSGAVTAIGIGARLLVSGEFTNFNLTATSSLVTIGNFGSELQDLQLDAKAHVLLKQSNSRWIAGGEFSALRGGAAPKVVRFDEDGTPDTAFLTKLGTGLDGQVNSGAIQPDGKILLGGSFTQANGIAAPRLVRLK